MADLNSPRLIELEAASSASAFGTVVKKFCWNSIVGARIRRRPRRVNEYIPGFRKILDSGCIKQIMAPWFLKASGHGKGKVGERIWTIGKVGEQALDGDMSQLLKASGHGVSRQSSPVTVTYGDQTKSHANVHTSDIFFGHAALMSLIPKSQKVCFTEAPSDSSRVVISDPCR